jgi:hypothetical protein
MSNPTGKGGFKKGQSGNPGGRPRDAEGIRELARSHAAEAVETLASIMNDKEKPPNARANAGGRRKPNPPPPLYVQTPPFGHGAGVGYGRRGITPTWAASREAAMIGVLNDLVLFSCLAAFVSGIVIAAATLII